MGLSHTDILKELCRICGQRARTTREIRKAKRPPKKVQTFASRIHCFYGLYTQHDIKSIHPDKVCTVCYMRMYNQKFENRAENKHQQSYIDFALKTDTLWTEHHDILCLVCRLYDYQKSAGSGRQTFLTFMEKIGKLGRSAQLNTKKKICQN